MPDVAPLDLDPAGPWEPATAYWWATAARLAYYPGQEALWGQLASLAGGTRLLVAELDDPTGLLSSVTLLGLPGGRRVVALEGTARVAQWVAHLLGPALVTWDGPGRVGRFFNLSAVYSAERIRPSVEGRQWGAVGHSLGGAVGGLLPPLLEAPPPLLLVDFGSPRSGDGEYAAAMDRPRLRVTGDDDPFPAMPPGTGTWLDEYGAYVPGWIDLPPVAYRHWGTRVHVTGRGQLLRPAEGTVFEAAVRLIAERELPTPSLEGHRVSTYARRVRATIPVAWPALAPDADFPGLVEMDAIHQAVNVLDGETWAAAAAPAPPAGPVFDPGSCPVVGRLPYGGPWMDVLYLRLLSGPPPAPGSDVVAVYAAPGSAELWLLDSTGVPRKIWAGTLPAASTTEAGTVELATPTEAQTGTDAARALTPASGRYTPGAARGWVQFDGTTTPPTVVDGYRVSSVSRNGTGDYTVNWADGQTHWCDVASAWAFSCSVYSSTSLTANINTRNSAGVNSNSGLVSVVRFGASDDL